MSSDFIVSRLKTALLLFSVSNRETRMKRSLKMQNPGKEKLRGVRIQPTETFQGVRIQLTQGHSLRMLISACARRAHITGTSVTVLEPNCGAGRSNSGKQADTIQERL